MPLIASYLLKLSVSLAVVYLFYTLVLRRLTFYNWNRWYLLGYSFLAFLIPFVNISPVLEQGEWDKSMLVQLIPVFNGNGHHGELQGQTFSWWSYLLAGAVVGIVLMMVRFLIRFISYQRIRKSAKLMVDGGVKLYHVEKSIIPFSFGNAIFLNPQLHTEEDLKQIIHHEFIHVKQKHTIDILWSELLCMLNWYNPFAWLIRKDIRQNLEFIADNKVLENGIDKKDYQYLLLKVTGAAHFSITQQFNFSSLKKRIVMMNRSRSAKIQLTRFLFLLPLLSILLVAFRNNVVRERTKEQIQTTQLQLQQLGLESLTIIDTVPARPDDQRWAKEFVQNHPLVKKIAIDENNNGAIVTVHRRDGIVEKYDWKDVNARKQFWKRYGATEKPVNLIEVRPDESVITDTAVAPWIDASLKGQGSPYLRPPVANVLLVIDGVVHEDGSAKLRDLDPHSIESINVLKSETAIQLYGDKAKGKEGVIEVQTRDRKEDDVKITADSFIARDDSVVFKGNPSFRLRNNGFNLVPLYVVDGEEYTPSEMEKLNLDPNSIESITVLKDETASKLYGAKAKNGVVIIKLKKPITKLELSEPWDSYKIREQLRNSEQVVHIINGNTYVSGGNSFAMLEGIVDHIIVKGKVYTRNEANRQFKKSQFSGAGTITAESLNRVHGINERALQLVSSLHEQQPYLPAKTAPSLNSPQ